MCFLAFAVCIILVAVGVSPNIILMWAYQTAPIGISSVVGVINIPFPLPSRNISMQADEKFCWESSLVIKVCIV